MNQPTFIIQSEVENYFLELATIEDLELHVRTFEQAYKEYKKAIEKNIPPLHRHQIEALKKFIKVGWLVYSSKLDYKIVKKTRKHIQPSYTVIFLVEFFYSRTYTDKSHVAEIHVGPKKISMKAPKCSTVEYSYDNNGVDHFIDAALAYYGQVTPHTISQDDYPQIIKLK